MAGSRFSLPPFPQSSALSKQRLSSVRGPGQAILEQGLSSSSDSNSDDRINYIPGEPGIGLLETTVCDFLRSELSTPLIDELYTHLWLVARKLGKSVDPLNRQRVRSREIIATEDIHLHLVWYHNKLYVKPMPLCLLNYEFWATYLPLPANKDFSDHEVPVSRPEDSGLTFDRKVALGFMRSYALLVCHRLDFVLARDSSLLPAELDWDQWSEFIIHFRHLTDEEVAKRYHYGQLRLARLNWAVRLFRPSCATTIWFYERPHWSTGWYMNQAITPLLFSFASLSLVLSSMQVLLAVPGEGLHLAHLDTSLLVPMYRAFWMFSIMMLLLSGLIWLLLFAIPFCALARQLVWGFRNREKSNAEGPIQPRKEVISKA